MKEVAVSFLDHFRDVKDPRIERKKIYPIDEILLVTVCAVICGAEGWKDLELFGKQKLEYLKSFLRFKNGIPTDDTFRRFFRSLDPEQFKKSFMEWVRALQKHNPKFVSIDGKTLRRSHDKATDKKAMHMVSAWCSEQGMVLGQFKTEEKSNEITAIPELLDLLSIEKSVITIDAMGCQKNIAKKIVSKKADYILAVKDNQQSLHAEITRFFNRHKALNYKGRGYDFKQFEETDKGHGRIEIRKCTVIDELSWMDERDKWQGIKSIVMVESSRIIGSKTTEETRYYITSLPAEPKKIANAIRSHWGIENTLHWVLDVTFNEDQSRIRKGHAPQNIAIVRHVALNMLKNSQKLLGGTSIKGLRKVAGWNNDVITTILQANF
jgi:predicted transposase YbfD/YdcC